MTVGEAERYGLIQLGPKGDPGYAVFGRVIEGMDVVRQILAQPRDPEAGAESGMQGQMLATPVQVRRVMIDSPPEGERQAAARP